MCGIAGFVGAPGAGLAALRNWGRVLEHRGPDGFGVSVLGPHGIETHRDPARIGADAEVVLWHRRLSILDLTEAGAQPMSDAGGRFHVVLNGEIYNYLELRAELEACGVHFRSRSDTEVLLAAFARWGVDALPRFTGMFALAVLDTVARRLVLARDPFGIKPLYHASGDWGFAFASEPKALLELPFVTRRVDPQRAYDYLRFGLTDHGDGTMFTSLRQLPAAHWLEVPLATGRPGTPVRYDAIDRSLRHTGGFERAADELRTLFLDSVRLHLRSDVPVGAALSGGIDSSAIVAAMRALEPELELHTFTYAAEGAADESRWAAIAAGAAGAVAHQTRARPEELAADLGALLATQDEPFASTSIYAQYRVFRLAREHGIKVMLDGQGADEMLGGYHTFAAARLASLVRQGRFGEALGFAARARRGPGRGALWMWAGEFLLPPGVQSPFRRLVGQELVPAWLDAGWFRARDVRLQPAKYTFGSSREVLREQLHRSLTHSSLPMLLRFEDRNSMAHSIESRVPFLTPALARFLASLPEEYLVDRDGCSKAVFRRAMRGLVPDAILDRRDKIGFATPEHPWLAALRPQIERRLSSEVVSRVPFLHGDAMRAAFQAASTAADPRDFRIWRWFNFLEWAERTGAEFE